MNITYSISVVINFYRMSPLDFIKVRVVKIVMSNYVNHLEQVCFGASREGLVRPSPNVMRHIGEGGDDSYFFHVCISLCLRRWQT